MRRHYYPIIILITLVVGAACNKQAFLDKKPNTTLFVPSSLTDFQSLLDNDQVMNLTPVLGEVSSDNFYFSYNYWRSLDTKEFNAYIWAPDLYNGTGNVDDWNIPYSQVFYSNVVLDGLPGVSVDTSNIAQWNMVKGEALFTRAYAFFNVAQLFAAAYDPATAASDLGIPIRLTSNINVPSTRASVLASYDQITGDLRIAASLLPTQVPAANLNRPSKPAAYAMLARTYLSMRKYDSAGLYADSALQLYSALINYSMVDSTVIPPIPKLNVETIYESIFFMGSDALEGVIHNNQFMLDTTLLKLYQPNDRRLGIFYKVKNNDTANIRFYYSGSVFPFSGLATDELYLIRAECEARAGGSQLAGAINDVNTLLMNRYRAGTFTPYSGLTQQQALDTILDERRKELTFRGLRWSDLRRLNKEGANDTLYRMLDDTLYTLLPNSKLYILPIPPDVIALGGILQNPRQ